MKNFALRNPLLFSLITTILFFLLMTCAYAFGELMDDNSNGKQLGQLIGKIIISLLLVYIIWRFNWLKSSGVGRIGNLKSWLIILIPGIFAIFSTTYAYTGIIKVPLNISTEIILTAANMLSGSLVEELIFRGLIFYCFLVIWASKKGGLLKSSLVSAIIFGLSHLVWVVLGKDLNLGLLQSLGAFGSGIFYAAIVIQTRSIWPAIIIHGLTNSLVYIVILEIPNYYETVNNGILDFLLGIPLIIYGLLVLMKYSKKDTLIYAD